MSQVKMTLSVQIEGSTLQEIQNGFLLAALQNGTPVVGGGSVGPDPSAAAPPIPQPPKIVVPPQGAPREYDEIAEKAAIEKETQRALRKAKMSKKQAEDMANQALIAQDPQLGAPPAPRVEGEIELSSAKPNTTHSRGDAVAALTSVNRAHNMDTAKACLTHFGVEKLSALEEGQLGAFIAHCRHVAAQPKAETNDVEKASE